MDSLCKKSKKDKTWDYRWNYVEDKSYPCNETRHLILDGLKKTGISADFLDKETEQKLWHILYSVESKQEIQKAFAKFAADHNLGDEFTTIFSKLPPFKKEYGAYSAKAIKKLLPLMRMGKYWRAEDIDNATKERIENIINGEYDESIRNRMRDKAMHLTDVNSFRGLPLWLACYVVYDRHSEAQDSSRWTSPADIDCWLNSFRQHSLRNPIVEKIILETMRTVRDIWRKYGHIDEIHIELGRDMKNPADKRRQMTERITENENTNMRIKTMLAEFMNPNYKISAVRPFSASQQELLRIYEEGAVSGIDKDDKDFEFINKFVKTAKPSSSDILRYKLWLDQKYRSPYTNRPIPLGKLFTSAYEIEHIIPQSRYFDDSFSNKVICESEVNKLKDRMLGHEFIKAHHGEKVQLSMGGEVEILSVSDYERLVQDGYKGNRTKMKKLLMDDIPDTFIERQLNDSRYISKVVKTLLSNIVREEGEQEAISKNVITCNGSITDRLKKEWGMGDVWNRIVLPRFKRLNELTGTTNFTTISVNGHEIPDMPLELQLGFNKKRIDHRHHAMDAIVIACTTRNHVNLLNNEAAMSKNNANRFQLSRKLRRYETITVMRNGQPKQIEVAREFIKPWSTFTTDVEAVLRNAIVSFKQNLRVINKTTNRYRHIVDGKKCLEHQTKGDSWAIRKSMHKDTVYGEINLRKVKNVSINEAIKNKKAIVNKDLKHKIKELLNLGYDAKRVKKYFEENKETWSDVNLKKIAIYYFSKDNINPATGLPKERYFATRFCNDLVSVFSGVGNVEKAKDTINKITDTGIQKILLAHLDSKDGDVAAAFSADGIDEMNKNIRQLNNGKDHKPIFKVRLYEKADKFAIGQTGNKSKKFVEAAKGTNLFFAVYENEQINKTTGAVEKKRSYATIPLNVVIDRQKQGLPSAPNDENGNPPIFVLSPNDLVYLPTKSERENGIINKPIDTTRIYKLVDSSKYMANFVQNSIAGTIYSLPKELAAKFCNDTLIQDEFGLGSPKSKNERAITGEMIKEICIPLKVDRLGNIIELNNKPYD